MGKRLFVVKKVVSKKISDQKKIQSEKFWDQKTSGPKNRLQNNLRSKKCKARKILVQKCFRVQNILS